MKVTITAKKLTINQSFTDYATQKLSAKLDRFFPEEAEAKITLEERRELIILELTVKYNGIIYRAEQSAKDKNDALDVTVDRVIRQIRKARSRVLHPRQRRRSTRLFARRNSTSARCPLTRLFFR